MFKALSEMFNGTERGHQVDILPDDPLTGTLQEIQINEILEHDERAYLEVPAKWHRYRSNRQHRGVSVRVAPGAYMRGGVSQTGDQVPYLLSEGRAVITSLRIKFIGRARSTSFYWSDVSGMEEGVDYVSLFREAGDTEILAFGQDLVKRGNSKLPNLIWRLVQDWRAQQNGFHPEGSSSSDDQADFDKDETTWNQLIEILDRSLAPEELEKNFRDAFFYAQSKENVYGADLVGASKNLARASAKIRLLQLVDAGLCNYDTENRLISLFEDKNPLDVKFDILYNDVDNNYEKNDITYKADVFANTLEGEEQELFSIIIRNISRMHNVFNNEVDIEISVFMFIAYYSAAEQVIVHMGGEPDMPNVADLGEAFIAQLSDSNKKLYASFISSNIEGMMKCHSSEMVIELRNRLIEDIFTVPDPSKGGPQANASMDQIEARLSKIVDLKDKGLISEDEYNTQKARILNMI